MAGRTQGRARRAAAGGVALLFACACSLGAVVPSFDLGGDEPEAFATAIAAGDTRRAYDMLCPGTRFGIPYESFRAAVEVNPYLASENEVTIDSYRSGGGVAVVKRGWIASTAGVADAQFHVSKEGEAWCVTGVVIGGTPVLPVPGTASAAGASVPVGGEAARRAAEDRVAALPATLRNDAYRAFGLSNPATRRYVLRAADEATGAAGTQRAELLSASSDAARFRIVRGGGLGILGSLEVELRPDGIHLVGSSQGALTAPTLLLPAKLEPGVRWETHYVVTRPDGASTDYRGIDTVEGRERIKVPAGEFDTVRIVSNATLAAGDQRGTVQTSAWYASEIGSIRVESETTIEGERTSRLVVELVEGSSVPGGDAVGCALITPVTPGATGASTKS